MSQQTFIIAGASLAGAKTAEEREKAYVHYLRTLADCDVLRSGCRRSRGGGGRWLDRQRVRRLRAPAWTRRDRDRPAQTPERANLRPEIGSFYRDVHAQHGIELMLGEGVQSFEGDGTVARVRTASGRVVDCDFAVVGIGVVPRVELTEQAGLEVDGGVLVDEQLQTSAPGVFAAGDIARAWHPFFGERIRVEHWSNALNQGPAAARAMLGEPVSYDRVPYFFSDQCDVGMEYSGHAPQWDEVVFRADRNDGEFIAFWLQDGRVIAGMNVNVWGVNEHVQTLIRSRQAVDVAALVDPDTSLVSLIGDPAPGS